MTSAGAAAGWGTRSSATSPPPQLGPGYTATVGDFTGDDRDDIYWYAPDGPDQLWTATGTNGLTVSNPEQGPGLKPILLPDSQSSAGKDDLIWEPATTPGAATPAALWVFPDDGSGVPDTTGTVTRPATATPVVGDFDGDGDADVLWYRPGTAPDPLWRRDGGTGKTFTATTLKIDGGYTPRVGRFSAYGDRPRDIVWTGSAQTEAGFSVEDGPQYVWEGRADGTFRSTRVPLAQRSSGFEVVLRGGPKDVIVNATAKGRHQPASYPTTDVVWSLLPGGPSLKATRNESLIPWFAGGPDVSLVTGHFTTAAREDLFVYRAGTATDSLWQVN
ncbi:hypothetical protein KSP35_21875 [Aquihabitans sp. G128]|uniref:hypothetical protein n=1 Tax=Aquihabitans sp. G128 TaxID=2849779 RepID=UPI001C2178B3|nr:hypothetical protein [Aquihabitans sp. G128]QXC60931.1 hypothetical protein KSP35_21875 [Aquihabitans sp. G128]